MSRVLEERAALVDLARLISGMQYLRETGIDYATAEVACGGVFVAPVLAVPPNSFTISEEGSEGVVVEALAEDGVTVLDLVTWRPSSPHRWRTLLGAAPALGMATAVNPATYFGGLPLQLYRTPLEWLQARCDGAVLLDLKRGARWLLDVDNIAQTLALRDDAHAAEIQATRIALITRQRLVVPVASSAPSLVMEPA